MPNLTELYSLRSKKIIQLLLPPDKIPAKFPGDWFAVHKTKPKVHLNLMQGDIKSVIQLLSVGIVANTKHAAVYSLLKHCFELITEEFSETWISFGQIIGHQGQTICPLNLLEIEEATTEDIGGFDSKIVEEGDKWPIMAGILALYRLGFAKTTTIGKGGDYFNTVKDRIIRTLQTPPFFIKLGDDLEQVCVLWLNSPVFCKLVACLDMFLFKFPNNWANKLRVCTIPSRMRSGSIMGSLNHTAGVLGMDVKQLYTFVTIPALGNEICEMMRDTREVDKKDSFLHYMSDFGLSIKNPYSAKMSPLMHAWLHMVGALLGSKRSQKAVLLTENFLPILKVHSLHVVFYCSQSCKQSVGKNSEQKKEVEKTDEDLDESDTKIVFDAYDLVATMKANDWAPSEEMNIHFRKLVAMWDNQRKHTIGNYLKNNI